VINQNAVMGTKSIISSDLKQNIPIQGSKDRLIQSDHSSTKVVLSQDLSGPDAAGQLFVARSSPHQHSPAFGPRPRSGTGRRSDCVAGEGGLDGGSRLCLDETL